MTAVDQARETLKFAALVVAGVLPASRVRLDVVTDSLHDFMVGLAMFGDVEVLIGQECVQTYDPGNPVGLAWYGQIPGIDLEVRTRVDVEQFLALVDSGRVGGAIPAEAAAAVTG